MSLNWSNNCTLLIVFFLSVFFSCKKNGDKNIGNLVLHPLNESIPYQETDYIKISTESNSEELNNMPDKLLLFKKYFHTPNDLSFKKLRMEVGSHSNLMGISLTSRLILLDGAQQRLIEYDLKKDSTTIIAEFGRGPGDIAHAKDIIKYDELIHVGMQDMRVSEFDCSIVPCNYSKTVKLERISPYSIDRNDSIFVVLGSSPVTGSTDTNSDELSYKPIFKFNQQGEKINSFGKTYDTKGHWMLLRPFTEGIIRYSPDLQNYLLAYHRLPYLYIYDSDYNLKDKYFFPTFILGKQKYWPEVGKLNIVMENHSIIKKVKFIYESLVLVEMETKVNMKKTETAFVWDRKADFYVIDLDSKRGYILGTIDFTQESAPQAIYYMDHGLMTYKSGSIYWHSF